jgi:NADH dehydrogenase
VLRAGVKFQPVFAGDVGEAVANALRDPESHGHKTYELGGPDVLSMGELLRWIAQALGRKPNFLEIPDFAGALLARLPGSPISWDQWLMLQQDNVVAAGAPGLAALGVEAEPLAAVAPEYLIRFRKSGRFGRRAETLAA